MALAVLTIACLLFYASSRYFPRQDIKLIANNKIAVLLAASAISIVSLVLFMVNNDFATSLVYWMIALMTLLSAIVLSVKLNFNWVWIWAGLCILFIIIDTV